MGIIVRIEASDPAVHVQEPVRSFKKGEISVGRLPDNDLVLPDALVSGHHALITVRPNGNGHGGVVLVDVGSTNGTFLEEKRLPTKAEIAIAPNQRIIMGGFVLRIAASEDPPTDYSHNQEERVISRDLLEAIRTTAPVVPEFVPPPAAEVRPTEPPVHHQPAQRRAPEPEPIEEPRREVVQPKVEWEQELKVKHTIREQLIERLDLKRKDIIALSDQELRTRAQNVVEQVLVDLRWELPPGLDRDRLIKQVLDEALGLGPLEELLADDEVSEIMVNKHDQIYAERQGRLGMTALRFSSEQAVLAAIERILAPIGRRVDESSPIVDARLKDGSRVNAVIRPLALNGPCITIRKFSKVPLGIDDLVGFGALSRGMADFLKLCVESRLNVVVSGGTGSGKTTLLNVLSSFVPDEQRVVTVEDAAELQLVQEHVVRFETRPSNLEGKGAVTIRDLVRNALRMRPDRIIVGECRGPEALDMLQAMNTGHDGSMTTGHANTPADMIRRLETMVLMAGLDMPVRAIREQIASAVNIIVQQTRFACGTRKVTAISEVTGLDADEGSVMLQDIFLFRQDGYDHNGKIRGIHQPSGYVPRFFRKMQERGLPVDASVFSVG